MSGPYFAYTIKDDMSHSPSSFSAGTEPKRGYHARQGSMTSSPASVGSNAVWSQFRTDVFPPTHWPAVTSFQAQPSTTTVQSNSSPFLPPPLLHGPPTPPHASHTPLHFGYNASSTVEHHLQTVAMPTPTGRYGGELIDAHACYYDPSSRRAHDDYLANGSLAIPSPAIAMPIVPTYLHSGVPSYMNPIPPSDSTLRCSPRYRTAQYQYSPSPGPSLSPSSPSSIDSHSYSSSTPPLSTDDHGSLVPTSFDMPIYTQPPSITTASLDPDYTLRVPLEAVKFPSFPHVGNLSFFHCRWEGCDAWMTSEKEAIKDHLARVHHVVLKGRQDDAVRCRWHGCSSSLQKCALMRHIQSHLNLQWLCSVCGGSYTRTDSVKSHAEREERCNNALAISHPSPLAYNVTEMHGNGTVTLTKVLQP